MCVYVCPNCISVKVTRITFTTFYCPEEPVREGEICIGIIIKF